MTAEKIPLVAVMGSPIAHSKSPMLHGYWLRKYGIKGHYIPIDVDPTHLSQVLETMSKMGFVGANVTIPHKENILKFSDKISDRAAMIGAANTLSFSANGQIYADNTDGYGFIENIRQQIKKERLDIKTMSNKRTKEVLKKLKYNKYYEHIPFIKDKLGVKPPIMTPELEETLCNLFIDIQAPYAKYCPEDRVNFLNYYYTIYKLCELLNQREFLPYFPMLKDREKRIEQDEIWKNICKELNWKFIPTI